MLRPVRLYPIKLSWMSFEVPLSVYSRYAHRLPKDRSGRSRRSCRAQGRYRFSFFNVGSTVLWSSYLLQPFGCIGRGAVWETLWTGITLRPA